MKPAFADYEFAPWTVVDGKRVVAPDEEWDTTLFNFDTAAEKRGDYYCPECKDYLSGSRVTSDEHCDTCGHAVEFRRTGFRVHIPVDVFGGWAHGMSDSHYLLLNIEWQQAVVGDGVRMLTMSDVRTRSFDLIDQTPNLTWLVSTEHTANIARMTPGIGDCPDECTPLIRPNLWLGARVTDQRTADERIPHLLRVPAAVRWLDITPTGPVDICCVNGWADRSYWWGREILGGSGINWVVVRGGDPVHLRSLWDQCLNAGVPFWCESAIDGKVYREFPTVETP